MKALFHQQRMRLFVYISLSILSVSAIFSVSFISEVFHLAKTNKTRIDLMEIKILEREAVSREYIPRFEKVEAIEKERGMLLERIMNRQSEITKKFERILEKIK